MIFTNQVKEFRISSLESRGLSKIVSLLSLPCKDRDEGIKQYVHPSSLDPTCEAILGFLLVVVTVTVRVNLLTYYYPELHYF